MLHGFKSGKCARPGYRPSEALIWLCYLQPVQWLTTRADSENCAVFRVSTTISCTLPFYFFLECYRWVMDFKATASRGVLIAQFEEYFDDALGSREGVDNKAPHWQPFLSLQRPLETQPFHFLQPTLRDLEASDALQVLTCF